MAPVTHKDRNANWTTLLEALYCILPPTYSTGKALCLPLQGVYRISGIGSVSVGWTETVLKLDMVVNFALVGIISEVKSVKLHYEILSKALPRDKCGLQCQECVCQRYPLWHVAGERKKKKMTHEEGKQPISRLKWFSWTIQVKSMLAICVACAGAHMHL